jgi:FkbM family methyltransferase
MVHFEKGIKIEYLFGEKFWNISTKVLCASEDFNFPLKLFFISKNGSIIHEQKLDCYLNWFLLPLSQNLDVLITDNTGEQIIFKKFPIELSLEPTKISFTIWSKNFLEKNGRKSNGIIIGSHDGRTGEWVDIMKNNLFDKLIFVEPNTKVFCQLIQNVDTFGHIFYNSLVSPETGIKDFFTNIDSTSESSSMIQTHNKNLTNHKLVHSFTLSNLIHKHKPDWVQIDTEGMDGKIIDSVSNEELISVKFWIWEHVHLTKQMKKSLLDRFQNLGFIVNNQDNYNHFAYQI